MFSFCFKLFVIYLFCVFPASAKLSDKRLCANKECTKLIAKAKTQLPYASIENGVLSFKRDVDVLIYSREAGNRLELVGVEIDGKRGYAPKNFLKETRVMVKEPKFMMPTEDVNVVAPDPVKEQYVVDGTKLPYELMGQDVTDTEQVPSSVEKTEPLETAEQQEQVPVKVEEEVKPSSGIFGSVIDSVSNLVHKAIEKGAFGEDAEDDEDDDDDEEEDDETVLEQPENSQDLFFESNDPQVSIENVEKPVSQEEKLPIKIDENENVVDLSEKNESNSDSAIKEIAQDVNAPQAQAVLDADNFDTKNTFSLLRGMNSYSVSKDTPKINTDKDESVKVSTIVPNVDKNEKLNQIDDNLNSKDNVDKVSDATELNEKQKEDLNQTSVEIENVEVTKPHVSENGLNLDVKHEGKSDEPAENVTSQKSESSVLDNSTGINLDVKQSHDLNQSLNASSENIESNEIVSNNALNSLSENSEQPAEIVKIDNKKEESIKLEETITDKLPDEKSFVPVKTPEINEETALKQDATSLNNVQEPKLKLETQKPDDSTILVTDTPIGVLPTTQSSTESLIVPPIYVEKPEETTQTPLVEKIKNQPEETTQTPVVEEIKNQSEETTQTPVVEEIKNQPEETTQMSVVEEIEKPTEETTQTPISEEIANETIPINENVAEKSETVEVDTGYSFWNSAVKEKTTDTGGDDQTEILHKEHHSDADELLSKQPVDQFSCAVNPSSNECLLSQQENTESEQISWESFFLELLPFQDIFILLVITGATIIIFLWGAILIEKSSKESRLIGKINSLEKNFLIARKENELLTGKLETFETDLYDLNDKNSNDALESLQNELDNAHRTCGSMEDQIQSLEKELSNSTEVGLELNRMLTDFLSSENGSDTLIANIDQLQRQLVEQQDVINACNDSLTVRETENHEMRLELDICNAKVKDLQAELNKMAMNLLKTEEDKEQLQANGDAEIETLKKQLSSLTQKSKVEIDELSVKLKRSEEQQKRAQSDLELKVSEYNLLKESVAQMDKSCENGETYSSLIDTTATQAELLQLRKEKQALTQSLQREVESKSVCEKQAAAVREDAQNLKVKCEDAERQKVEAQTKLEVLSNYFKEKEAQLQSELNKQESMWIEKQGETTSTIERFKYMQEELQNYKAQCESLKQELVSQEVDLKSQISVQEAKAHESWVFARQAERKLDEAKQEAGQLRNRLTLRERSLNEEKGRVQSPLEQNGDVVQMSPMHVPGADGLVVYGGGGVRDHLTTSPPPPLAGLPPFPPPPGMPPPPGVPPFIPPPPGSHHPMGFLPPPLPPPASSMPVDHRPPPLGRMSSPPVNSRYSPDSRYSPFRHRNSPSPTSDDDYDYRNSPPPHRPSYRGYSPFKEDDRHRDYNRSHHQPPPPGPPAISNKRQNKNSKNYHSSGSANSNESLEKINRYNYKF